MTADGEAKETNMKVICSGSHN
ncbi:rCG32251 [Rattus norvegicus]|uniref:RCG32251 n=1 Tax=Rattus norvegicus TaxID=10116 RepID=A6JWR5_RAT|nr:rCG32251 [Rattus norvegicus]